MNIRAYFVCSVIGLLSLTLPLYSQENTSSFSAPRPRITMAPTQNSGEVLQQRAAISAYQQEQRTLIEGYRALVTSGASEEQIQQWISDNASRIQAQVEKAQAITLGSQSHAFTGGGAVRLPSDFGSAGSDYISNQSAMSRSSATLGIRTSLMGNGAGNSFPIARTAQGGTLSQAAFVQQNAPLLNQQRQLAATIASVSAEHMPALSDAERIPQGATPQVISFLNTRRQLSQKFAQFQKQYATAEPAIRLSALTQWRKQNSALLLQLQNEASDMSNAANAPSAGLQN